MPLINAHRVYELFIRTGWTQQELKDEWQQLKKTLPHLKDEKGFGSQTISDVLKAGKAGDTQYQAQRSTRRKFALLFNVEESEFAAKLRDESETAEAHGVFSPDTQDHLAKRNPILQPPDVSEPLNQHDLRIIIPEDFFNADVIEGYSQNHLIHLLDQRKRDGIFTLHELADIFKKDSSRHSLIVARLKIAISSMDDIMDDIRKTDPLSSKFRSLSQQYELSHAPFHLSCARDLATFQDCLRSWLQPLLTYQLRHLTMEQRELRHEEHWNLFRAWESADYPLLLEMYLRHYDSFRQILRTDYRTA